jgi:hypothetical protein
MISKGDKVWVWHFGSLKEIEVTDVTEVNGQVAVIYPGFAATHFFATRNEAVEHRLSVVCSMARSLEEKRFDRELIIKELIHLAKETQVEI